MPGAARGRLRLGKWDLKVVAEALAAGERLKPFQVAKRMVFARYGILGTSKDRVFTALVYGAWRVHGLADRLFERATGTPASRAPRLLRALVRLYTFQRLWAHREHPDMTVWIERYAPALIEARLGEEWLRAWSTFVERLPRLASRVSGVERRFMVSETLYRLLVGFIGRREARRLLDHVNSWIPPVALRVNRLKASVEEVVEALRRAGGRVWVSSRHPYTVFVERGTVSFRGLGILEEGKAIVQDEPSAIASVLLDPKPGMVVVDMCAAPGGKTTHLAELMEARGTIYAFELYHDRASWLRETLERHGVAHTVEVVEADARLAPRILGEEVADRVLVDPPCSSTGTIARNPDVRWRLTIQDLRELTRLQRELLEAAVRLAKPGGRILYSVCSLLREEGEEVVAAILKRHPEVRIVPLNGPYDPSPLLPGTMRSWPHRHNVTGFYYALLEKTA